MNADLLQDRISRGMGVAARHLGAMHDAYRPAGRGCPIDRATRFLRLGAAFNAEDPDFRRPSSYGRPVWYGVFDSAYLRPGDYLKGPYGVFFVAALQSLLPPICVLTNCAVSVARPGSQGLAGLNGYGGVTKATSIRLLSGWPASVLAGGGGGPVLLPSDGGGSGWVVLLPRLPDASVALRASDVVTDDLGRSFVVSSAELSELGWRLAAKLVAT